MKIIKDNCFKESEKMIEFECTCPHCKSILMVNENDIKYDIEGEKYVICPCCNDTITNEYFKRTVTLDNVSYPFDFYKVGDNDDTVHLTNENINKYIQGCIELLKKYPDEPYRYVGTGDSLIIVFNHDEEYNIIVAKNYEETFIDKT